MKLGTLAVSNVSTQPSRISLAAIQSVRVMRSQPVSLPAFEGVRDLGDELVVAVDDLLVVDLVPYFAVNAVERRVLGLVVRVDVHVVRPVRPVELGGRRRDGPAAGGRRRVAAALRGGRGRWAAVAARGGGRRGRGALRAARGEEGGHAGERAALRGRGGG